MNFRPTPYVAWSSARPLSSKIPVVRSGINSPSIVHDVGTCFSQIFTVVRSTESRLTTQWKTGRAGQARGLSGLGIHTPHSNAIEMVSRRGCSELLNVRCRKASDLLLKKGMHCVIMHIDFVRGSFYGSCAGQN